MTVCEGKLGEKKKTEKKKRICHKYQKVEIVSEITCRKGIPHRFQRPNVQHIGFLTEKWIEMASLLGNTKILFEPHSKKCNITRFWERNLYHTKEFESRQS